MLDGHVSASRTTERELASSCPRRAAARLIRTVDALHGDDWSSAVAPARLDPRPRGGPPGPERRGPGPAAARRGRATTRRRRRRDHAGHDVRLRRAARRRHRRARRRPSRARSASGCWPAPRDLDDAIDAVPDDRWATQVERTPGGRAMRAELAARACGWRELEIHHADLGRRVHAGRLVAGRSPSHLLDSMAKRLRPARPFEVRPRDSDRAWVVGGVRCRRPTARTSPSSPGLPPTSAGG